MKSVLRLILAVWMATAMPLIAGAAPQQAPEVRAVWLTTNLGLDWPGGEYSPELQKKKLTKMLDALKKAHFNMVVFQVQANGDVLWPSKLQPMMADVTGPGATRPGFDVCRYVIDECHSRGMDCHAWIVPFRLGTAKQAARYAKSKIPHPYNTKKKTSVDHRGIRYLDPSQAANRQYLLKLYAELLDGYDFDGINLDYTRYPAADFADGASYARRADRSRSLADWRRDNINTFVAELYALVKSKRPAMIVGSAPIGTYKNVDGTKNASAYADFMQDPGQWIESGHHDLIIPQMYWGEKNGFSRHMATWASIADGAHLVVGLAPYRMATSGWNPDEIIGQIKTARANEGTCGICFFRAEHVVGPSAKARKLYRMLCDDVFASPAPLPWR